MRLTLLSSLVEMAVRLRPGEPSLALAEAFAGGLALLEAGEGSAQADHERIRRRARFEVQRQRALALTRRQEELERAVSDLATESLALQDRLWDGHERASRMKVELGRRREATQRPEAPLTIGASGRRRAERAERLLARLDLVEVDLELGADAPERAAAVVDRHGWGDERFDDAVVSVVAYGLAAIEAGPGGYGSANGSAPSATPAASEALAYRLFELSESVRILEIRENAFRTDNRGMRLRLEQLEEELGVLEGEITALRERPDGGVPTGLRRRLIDRLRRKWSDDA